ncbi:TIGR00341 family protein [Limibacter armeniacum]|uniref:TIGR00341 family protein n=1 Tax=Limibacter armeniacum TaxID=466084 RepID=UPI002FE5FB5A
MNNTEKETKDKDFLEMEGRKIQVFLRRFVFRITHLASDTDVEGTIQGIQSGVVLSGSHLWMLICSVFIACIGLDTDSPAVIIGAMLVSPLMSPILGIGLSVGINDREMLGKSLRNFMAATFLSLFVSYVYFQLSPLGEYTDEMKARVSPTILDAFVAFFGGLAGIIAGSRTEKTNAVPGVAIATALMPPLCTAGFGLATGQAEVFAGAFYLFFINAVLISVSTYLIVTLLKFPKVGETDPAKAQRTKTLVYAFLLLLLIPSIIFLLESLRNITRHNTVRDFISKNIHEDVDKGAQWNYTANDSIATLRVYYFGQSIGDDSVKVLEGKIKEAFKSQILLGWYDMPDSMALSLTSTEAPPDKEKEMIKNNITALHAKLGELTKLQEEERSELMQVIKSDGAQIDSLKSELLTIVNDSIPFGAVEKELKAFYPELKELSVAKAHHTSFGDEGARMKYMAVIRWDSKKLGRYSDKKKMEKRLADYLSVKLGGADVQVVGY